MLIQVDMVILTYNALGLFRATMLCFLLLVVVGVEAWLLTGAGQCLDEVQVKTSISQIFLFILATVVFNRCWECSECR